MAYTDDDDDYKYEKDDDYYDDDDDDDYRLGDDDDDDESLSKPSSSSGASRFGVQPFGGNRPTSPSSGGLPGGSSRFGSTPSGGSPAGGSSPFGRPGTGSLGSGSGSSGSGSSASSGSSSSGFGGASRFGGSSPSGGTPSGGSSSGGSSPSGSSGFNRPSTGSLGSGSPSSGSSGSNNPSRFGGSPSSPSGGSPSGSSGFNRPGTGSLGSGSSASGSSGSSGSGSSGSGYGGTPRFGSSPAGGGSPSSPSGGTPTGGQPRFGAQSAPSNPSSPAKPTDKKDEKPASSGGGFGARFSGGAKPDDKKPTDKPASSGGGVLGGLGARFGGGAKPDDKKPTDKPASSGGGVLGGLGARFGGGAKPDDKKDDKKPTSSGGGVLGGLGARFGGGAKTDDKKDDKKPTSSGGGVLGGLGARFGGGAKTDDKKDDKPATSVGGMFNRGATSASPPPTASTSSASSASGAKPPATPFGAKPSTPTTDTKSAKSASAPAPSGGGLSRFASFLRRGQPEQKPPTRAKATASKAPTVSNNEGLTLDNWLDIIGVSLVFGAMVLLFSAGSSEQAAIGGLLNFVGELLGWGAMAVPVTMLAVGMWLIVRHFGENAPTIDPIRVVGVVLAFVALLILFQYIDSLSYPSNMPIGLLELRLQQAWDIEKAGGGAVGAALYYFLIRNVTEIGGIFVVGFVFLVAGMLITRSSASDMLTQGVGVARNTRANLQQRAINQRAQRQLKAQQLAEQKAQSAPLPAPTAESVIPALGQVAMVSAATLASGDNREIRFNRGGENLAQPQATPQTALSTAQSAPLVAPAPNFATASAPPQPTANGGIFGRIRGNSAPNAPIAPPPIPVPAPNAPATANGGLFGRFARPNNAPEPIAPPLVNPLPLDDDIPSPQPTTPSYTPSQPIVSPTPSMADLMRPTIPPATPPSPSSPSFSASSAVSGTGDASTQPFSRMMSPYERTTSPSSPTPTATPSPAPAPMPTTPSLATNGFGASGNKFSSELDDDEDDDLRDDFDDFDEEDDDEAYTPSRPAPSSVASPLADRNDRLNRLRSGNTGVPSTPTPSIIQPMQPSAPLYNPSAPTFGGIPQQPATTMPTPDGTFGIKQPSIFGESGTVTPPSQLPSAQPNNQPSQHSLSVPFSGAVINQTRASRPQWKMPDFRTLLSSGSEQEFDRELLLRQAKTIEDTLNSFGSPGKVVEVNTGPVITQFGVEPDYVSARGKKQRVKVGAIAALDKDLQLALGARSIRVEAPVPGKGYVGVEVPNKEPATVRLRDVMESPSFLKHKSPLGIALGQSVSGAPISADLASMPHLLIAGTTGSGKSVCVNAIITSILARNAPDVVKFIMVDPKRVELTGYNGIPHLVAPVVVELERIVGVLKWVTREMDDRYKKFSDAGARNIEDYNKHIDLNTVERMPYIIVIIDELADLMMLAPEETEKTITRIAALARATGIHLVIATQRPSVDVVTGLIKANFPARIAFAVAGGVDSRVILDQPGAERLLGRGDMLYLSGDSPAPLRLQGVYVSDMEIQNLVRYWKVQAVGQPELRPLTSLSPSVAVEESAKEIMPRGERVKQQAFWDASVRANTEALPNERSGESLSDEILTGDDGSEDEMYEQAVELVRRLDKASVSLLQRRLRIGYTRAARLIDVMEARGVIGPAKDGSSKPRDVIPQK